KDRERLLAFIADETVKRVRRNRAFLSEPADELPPQPIISAFGRLADDFFVSILLLKSADEQNLSLPFLHAQVLELSAQAACQKLSVSLAGLKNSRDISAIYEILGHRLPEIATWAPTPLQLAESHKMWLREDAPQQNAGLLPPGERDALEVA